MAVGASELEIILGVAGGSMIVHSSIMVLLHINGPVTWREVAVLAIVVGVLYYCKRRYRY
jgi:hypothetical protein